MSDVTNKQASASTPSSPVGITESDIERDNISFLARWRWAKGYSRAHLMLCVASGFHPKDLAVFEMYTAAHPVLLVFRCPNYGAHLFHDMLEPKPSSIEEKSGIGGVGVARVGDIDKIFVSDYDLLCCYENKAGAARKIFCSELTEGRCDFTSEFGRIFRMLNSRLVAKLQHGCQDDWVYARPGKHPGVKRDKCYIAFVRGQPEMLKGMDALHGFYDRHRLVWPYTPDGMHRRDEAAKWMKVAKG